MASQVQYRRGTNAQNAAFTGALAEITVDTTNGTLRVHDAITVGGSNIATVAYVTSQISALSSNSISFGTSSVAVIASGGNIRANVGGSTITNTYSSGLAVTGLISATGTVTGTTLTGTSLTVSTGNITGGNLILSGAIVDSGQLDIQTTASNGNIVLTPNGTGNVNTGANVSVTGRVTTASVVGGVITGSSVSVTGAQTAASTVGGVITGSSVSVTGAVTSASVVGGIMTGTSLSATGNVSGGNLIVTGIIVDNVGNLELQTTVTNGNVNLTANGTGNINVNANIMPTGNGTANIGSTTLRYNTIFAKATSAQYADLAEMYSADKNYVPGTVVVFGGEKEITISTQSHSTQVAGIISTNPSYLMNSSLNCANALEVALVGRVPCQVVGTISKGDRLVSSGQPGVATTLDMQQYQPGCILGKALEDYQSTEVGIIEVAVGRT